MPPMLRTEQSTTTVGNRLRRITDCSFTIGFVPFRSQGSCNDAPIRYRRKSEKCFIPIGDRLWPSKLCNGNIELVGGYSCVTSIFCLPWFNAVEWPRRPHSLEFLSPLYQRRSQT